MINKNELMHLYYVDDYDLNRIKAEEFRIKFTRYLQDNPYDTEIWIKFALMLYLAPLHEDLGAQKCLETVLHYDPNNIYVSLFRIYVIEHYSYMDDSLFNILTNIQSSDKLLMSLVEYTKSSYFYSTKKDFKAYEKCLLDSIELCDKYLWNYVDLGQFYIKGGYLHKGYEYINRGLQNLEYVYKDNISYNVLDIEEFFNERFKGIHLSQWNYEIILESFDPNSPWITGDFITKRRKEEIQ